VEGRVEGEGRGRPGRSQRLGAGGSKEGWRRGGDLPLSSRSVWRFRGRWGGGRARGPAAEEKQNSHHVFFIRGLSERAAHPPLPCGVCACTWRAGAERAARVHSHAFFNLPSSSVQARARDPGFFSSSSKRCALLSHSPPFFLAPHTREIKLQHQTNERAHHQRDMKTSHLVRVLHPVPLRPGLMPKTGLY